jgi:4,5-dihydroxyphthalate decarboxylase
MAKLRLNLACSEYDRTRPLLQGAVVPEGIDLNFIPLSDPAETFWRMLRHAEFHASELSLSNYMMGLARGDTRFIALPIFTYRMFRHSMLWVREAAGIREPKDLIGKRVGVPEYAVTAMLFARGMLEHEYGVLPRDVRWYRNRTERVPLQLPSDVRIEQLPLGQPLDTLLDAGELDAVATFTTPRSARDGSGRVHRLFPNVRAVEADYYRRTKIFPVMHMIVLRRDVYEGNQWAAQSLVKAFQAAKEHSYQDADQDVLAAASSLTPWLRQHSEEAREVFGGDIYPYGVKANLPTLEAATQYSHEQHLSARRLSVEELFAPETLDAFDEHG